MSQTATPGTIQIDGHPDQSFLFQKDSDRKQQVSDVTHPEHVSQFIDLPVVNCLGEEKTQRQ